MCTVNNRLASGAFAVAVCLLQLSPGRADEELYRQVVPSTALVYKSQVPLAGSAGTGFLIDDKERLLVTARHVVENINGGLAPAVAVIFAQTEEGEIITDARHYRKNWQTLAVRGKVIYDSVRRDLAVLQLDKLPGGIKPLKLAAKQARPGQMAHVIGNSTEPFGGVFCYCQGRVRNVLRYEELGAQVVFTQAPTNKGDSGGPLVNNLGDVVGLASMSTIGGTLPKANPFHDVQVTNISICVTEIREALQEMRSQLLAGKDGLPIRLTSQKMVTFKGDAKSSVHLVALEKDIMYRILVKAEGFVPDVRIDNNLVNPAVASTQVRGNDWQHLFTPTETKGYRIGVGHFPGPDIGKGPFPYTLTVDQIAFEPETAFKGPELKLNEHVKKLEAGKAYDIAIKGKGFEPDVQIVHGTRTVFTRYNNGQRANSGAAQGLFEAVGLANAEFETAFRYVAGKTANYRILIAVSPFSPPGSGPLNYTVTIVEPKVRLSVNDQLTAKEPRYPQAGPFKVHTVKLEAGKDYQIDLITTAFDSHVLVEDSAGKAVMHGFDAEGFSSRLFFRPTKTDTYRVLATARQIEARGPYTLTVADSPKSQPGLPGGGNKPFKGMK